MKRAVAYARFSSDLQREESIDAQVRAIQKHCEQNDLVLLTVYADRAISGTSDNRPEFQRMVADSAKDKFDIVVVHKLDRFARNRYDSAVYKNILKKHGVRLLSVLENLQDTPESIILESVIEGYNEYYSVNLAREVKKGLQENALQCQTTGGPPPLGYQVDSETKRFIVNKREAEAVRLIFQMYLDGHSYGEIIGTLNAKGYRTRRGVAFAKNSLYALLRNERYTGVYVYVKDSTKNPKGKYVRHGEYEPDAVIRIPGGMPQIISPEDFAKVQEKMKERQHKSGKFTAKQEYLLSGKIECGVCGSPYAGNSRKPRPDHPLYVSYRCTKRNRRLSIADCNNHDINRDKLEAAVLQKLSERLFDPKVIPALVKEYNDHLAARNSGAKDVVQALKNELRQTERKIGNAIDLMIETGSASLKNKLRELEESKERLQFEIAEKEGALKQTLLTEEQVRALFQNAKQQLKNGTLTNRRMIVDQYIQKVVVYPDYVEVYMNLTEDYVLKEKLAPK